jgi:hypothetical protein
MVLAAEANDSSGQLLVRTLLPPGGLLTLERCTECMCYSCKCTVCICLQFGMLAKRDCWYMQAKDGQLDTCAENFISQCGTGIAAPFWLQNCDC